jgi:hypothetical protein
MEGGPGMEKALKWIGTGIGIVGMILTAMNVYPLNIVLASISGGCWTAAGVISHDAPLWFSSAITTAIFSAGTLNYFLLKGMM